ncbi:hypothetical protein POM88_032125 [Heracleum sosnowskyi]|uniref:F-box domain-containing protein n=1 Tax=Heracleum sosnowskyi TaxID=360622 RepID=A0AAD8MK95_9APIA|nr:hypothetical protein POM88_032125 [Heracleum sosnowskyi]
MADSFKKRRIMSDFICQDILMEILKRLSVKSLVRFTCVQKSWYHLIQSPDLVDLHYHHMKNKNKYLLFQNRYHSDFFLGVDDKQCNEYYSGLPFPYIPKDMETGFVYKNKIHGTCQGLICFSAEQQSFPPRHWVFLWNPAIRLFKILPNSPDSLSRDQRYHDLALGYFPKINDYKVIKFQSNFSMGGVGHRVSTVYIYSLSTDSWKTVGQDNVAQFSRYEKLYNSVILNGVAYWVGIIRDPFTHVIVCFDIEKEKIGEIILAPQNALDAVSTDLIFSFNLVQHFDQVLLSAVCMNWRANTPCILDIFALGNDGVDVVCTKKVTIDFNKVGRNWWPIGFRYSGEIVVFNYHYNEGGFLSYDHDKEVATEILDNSWKLWSYAAIRTPDNPGYDYVPRFFEIFDVQQEHMQFMYVNSFEESLVLLGDKRCLKARN